MEPPLSGPRRFLYYGVCFLSLPDDREERLELLRTDSTAYIRRMGRFELLKVVEGLMRSGPLSEHDVDELLDERYPIVAPEFIPDEWR